MCSPPSLLPRMHWDERCGAASPEADAAAQLRLWYRWLLFCHRMYQDNRCVLGTVVGAGLARPVAFPALPWGIREGQAPPLRQQRKESAEKRNTSKRPGAFHRGRPLVVFTGISPSSGSAGGQRAPDPGRRGPYRARTWC